MGPVLRVKRMVEKPAPEAAPSNVTVIGRYILTPEVLGHLERAQTGAGGEIQFTDAIAEEIRHGRRLSGYRFKGERFDCGSKAGIFQATVAFGLAREDLREEFEDYLRSTLSVGGERVGAARP